jgi:hypothetical protein
MGDLKSLKERLRTGVLFLVPLLYLALMLWLQPGYRLGDPVKAPWLGRLVYDDYDFTALALRGLNAARGRPPGRPDQPPMLGPAQFPSALAGADTLAPRYFLEYPHTALWLFRLPYLSGEAARALDVPAAVADAHQGDLVQYTPRTDAEFQLWRQFRLAIRVYAVCMTGCLLLLLAVLRHGYGPGTPGPGRLWLLLLPATLYFALNRFDILPTLLVALSLASLGRRRLVLSAAWLGLATLVKVFPVVLAPLIVRYLAVRARPALVWVAAFALTVAAGLLPTLALVGWEATLAPYRFQLARPLETGYTIYGVLVPQFLGGDSPAAVAFRLGTLGLTLFLLLLRRPADLTDLLRQGTVLLAVFLLLARFFSPQWLLWLTPLVIPLAATDRRLAAAFAALDILTYLTFPVAYDWSRWLMPEALDVLNWYRFGALIALAALAGGPRLLTATADAVPNAVQPAPGGN